MNRLKQLLHMNDEMAVTMMVMAIFIGWYGLMYLIAKDVWNAWAYAVSSLAIAGIVWMAVMDFIDERRY